MSTKESLRTKKLLDGFDGAMKTADWGKKKWRTSIARRHIGAGGSRIFLVHGRNIKAASWIRSCLTQIGMRTIEWDQAIHLTGSASPYILDTVRSGMSAANATIVLFTGDEEVKLRQELRQPGETENEGYQSRPNVWLEAGIALAIDRERTIFIEYGNCRGASDLGDVQFIRYAEGDPVNEFLRVLAARLMTAGCKSNLLNIVHSNG